MQRQRRVLAIHDISCFGKCSLTVALPILSAAGIETTILPTAVLSTHTGGFSGFTFRDLTQDIYPIIEHWDRENIKFDAVYTGFLGSFQQIDIVSDIFDHYKQQGAKIIVDPVMADHGKLYTIFNHDFPAGMRKLCKKADLIVPNMTEAHLLLEQSYQEGPYRHGDIENIVTALGEIGPSQVVLTGVYFDEHQVGAMGYDALNNEKQIVLADRIQGDYHGTGDVYASALVGSLLQGVSLQQAIRIAVEFTVDSILRTQQAKTDRRFGVQFETGLANLATKIMASASEGQDS